MDLFKVLSSCKKVNIYGINNLGYSETFESLLDEIISENELIILVPSLKSVLLKLDLKEIYDITFFCEDSPYSCKMKINKYIVKDGLNCAKITLLTKLSRVQRRESYRLQCNNVTIKFNIFNEEMEINPKNGIIEDEQIELPFSGIIRNISTGGIKFNSNEKLEVNTILNMLIELEDKTLLTKGKVLFSEELEYEKYKYSYKLCFIDLSKSDKVFLEKYIFNEQVKILKKNRK